ncbi:MFS transporter [Micrococcales bacterium 31B]|nr:MFS transporter [Micrococcales bacterium 31B]
MPVGCGYLGHNGTGECLPFGNSVSDAKTAVGLRSERGPILLSVMLSTGLVAIDTTILATAVPSIVAELGDYNQFPWLFSVYLLAQAVTVPVYAKLSDTIGRKPLILFGVAVFLLGSILCGLAWNMVTLIIFRGLQGLGAGAISPVTLTIVGDIYTVEERARVQGYIAGVWAVCSVLGPTLGGVFAQYLTWRWVFWVNVPLCLITLWMLWRSYHEKLERRSHRIDYPGAIVLTLALVALILATLEGGIAWSWTSPQSLGMFAVGAALLVGFVLIERRAAEPLLAFSLVRRRVVFTTTLVSFMIGGVVTGITSFAPTYLEHSIHLTPLQSGFAIAAFTVGWPIAATTSGGLYLRFGFRNTAIAGSVIATAGVIALAAFAHAPSVWTMAIVTFVVGFGLGWTNSPTLVAAQSSVAWNERGVVTGLSVFARTGGSAIAVAIYGAISNSIITAGRGEDDFDTIVSATSAVFVAIAVTAVVMTAFAVAMPRDRQQVAE